MTQTTGDHFWGAAHAHVVNALAERDRAGFDAAVMSRRAVAWLQRRAAEASDDSFGLHRFAVMAVKLTLQQLHDADARVSGLYAEWDTVRATAAEALRKAAAGGADCAS